MLRLVSRYFWPHPKYPACNAAVSPHHCFLSAAAPDATQDASRGKALPRQASVVICGGGIAGLSAAYHLAKLGLTDVVLLEQGRLTSGTTWHSSGMVGQFRKSLLHHELALRSAKLYQTLEDETGLSTGYKTTGSILLAQTKDRMIDMKRSEAIARARKTKYTMLAPSEINSIVPWIRTDDLEGAMYFPNDGVTDPTNTALSLARGAKNKGAIILEGVQIQGVISEDGKVSQIQTSLGDIGCEYFVNAAGQWARDVGLMSRPIVNVPMHSTAHMYLITKPLQGVEINKICVRDFDSFNVIREWNGGLMSAGWAPVAKPIFHEGIPEGSEFLSLPEDWEHFQDNADGLLNRVPAASQMETQLLFTGPECFTPDVMFLFGQAAEIRNYYLMTGISTIGLTMSGGLGQLLAELIIHGESRLGYWAVDPHRFSPQQNNKAFLKERVTEVEGTHVKIPHPPSPQYSTGRKLRCTALYSRHAQDGAVFGETMGVEIPLWFTDKNKEKSVEDMQRETFAKPGWFDAVRAEYWACRKSVGVADVSAYATFELTGEAAMSLLQKLCYNDLDIPVGSVVHSGMLNKTGRYELDCRVARIDTNRYFIICPTLGQVKGHSWISRHLPRNGLVTLRDVTSHYTGLNVLGPKARDVLQKLTTTPLNLASFKQCSHKILNLGFTTDVHIISTSNSSMDGMTLLIPNESAVHTYELLLNAGCKHGIRPVGEYALKWLRVERFICDWGADFNSEHTPLELGSELVLLDKKVEFIGQSALLKQHNEGIQRRLAVFILEDHKVDSDLWCWGGEPIYRNGQLAGMTTSSGYSAALGSLMCLGWLHNTDQSTEVCHEIDVAGRMFTAKAFLHPPKV